LPFGTIGSVLMRTHIDWLTFTIPMIYGEDSEDAYALAIQKGLMDMFTPALAQNIFGGAWTHEKRSRAPYKDTWMDAENGFSVYASPNLIHCTVEISGQGCERLIEMGKMDAVLGACHDRITRIDVATDIETSTRPSEFVQFLSHERMRASGYQRSETGETSYVGSKKSDRYARVYRYNPPHPRANLLRIEHVFRRKYAKVVAKEIVDKGVTAVASASGRAFGWGHVDWNPEVAERADISVVKAEHGGGNTVSWLVRSVAPAIKRLISDGTIVDADAFFERYFKP